MKKNTSVEQSIAVFGESGCGKTVLLSAFYGGAQEPAFMKSSTFRLLASDSGEGSRLHRNYLGMRDSNTAPAAGAFKATSYSFDVTLKAAPGDDKSKAKKAVRLTWHDYPGEWFEQDPESQVELDRRIETFRALLGSDVALLVVDGQRLVDNRGEEERYLKALFTGFRTMLSRLQPNILGEKESLQNFPRIWVVALTKADLLPDLGAVGLRDLVIGKAGGEVEHLRETIGEFIAAPEALSIGEDFVCLSSARFLPGRIEVAEKKGVDLILPIASVLPLERQMKWKQIFTPPRRIIESLASQGSAGLKGAASWLAGLRGESGPVKVVRLVGQAVSSGIADNILDPAIEALQAANRKAIAEKDVLGAALTQLTLDLKRGEDDNLLVVSGR